MTGGSNKRACEGGEARDTVGRGGGGGGGGGRGPDRKKLNRMNSVSAWRLELDRRKWGKLRQGKTEEGTVSKMNRYVILEKEA